MGNIVTNIIKFTGRPEALKAALTSAIGEAADQIDTSKVSMTWEDDTWVDFTLSTLVPEPGEVTATDISENLGNLGLAILSVGGVDWLRLKQDCDPVLLAMPPHYTQTSHGLLEQNGLSGLEGQALQDKANATCPGAIPAGEAIRTSFEKTGHFNSTSWRAAKWGTMASPVDAIVKVESEDCVSIRFDTVNAAPDAWFIAFAKANPEVMCEGAGYDEDTDYSVRFVGDEPGEILIEESDDPEAVQYAKVTVHGPKVDEDCDNDGLEM